MRDLHKTLQLFAEDFPMDYCEEFDEVKSVLEYCNRHVKPFNKIHFRGGNEPYINEMVRRLQEVFVNRQLLRTQIDDQYEPIVKNLPTMRKVMMFLFVNTDVTYKYNLREDPNIAHVLEVCPLLPKFLLVTLVWDLHMDICFYEALSYMPLWFAFQYFDVAADSLKYIEDPFEVLEKVHQLVRAILTNIIRCEQLEIDTIDKKIIFNKLYDYTMNLLRQFYTPDAEKFKQFKKNEFFRYSGYALKHLLEMVLLAFDLYENAEMAEPETNTAIYDVCLKLCKMVVPKNKCLSKELRELQLKLTAALLNSLQYNVMQVKIDVFMYWVEIDLDESHTLQEVIGEMAYNVSERMVANHDFAHDVLPQLKMICLRPKTLQEKVADASIGDILRTLDEPLPHHIKKVWFDELMERTVALGNEECLQAMEANIKLMDVRNCIQIMDYIKLKIEAEQVKDESVLDKVKEELTIDELATDVNEENNSNMEVDVEEEFDQLAAIVRLALNNFKTTDILVLLEYQTKLFGLDAKVFRSIADYELKINEFFNKFINNFDHQNFLTLSFEYPAYMWSKFFDAACSNEIHTVNFCNAVKQARPFSNYYFNQLLSAALEDPQKLQQKAFPQLLCNVFFTLYFPERCHEFLKHFISDNVLHYIELQQYESLLTIVIALNNIDSHKMPNTKLNFGERTAPVLLLVANILDQSRWDLKTYTDIRDQLVGECIQFITKTTNNFLSSATKKDRVWITKCVTGYSPTTKYYFQRFNLTQEQTPLDFDRFLEIDNKDEPLMFLVNNFTRCTTKEAKWLANSERLLPYISEMLIMFGEFVEKNKSTETINNYRHCLASYINILNTILIPKVESDSKKIEKLLLKILKIIHSTPAEIYEETFLNFENLLIDITKKIEKPIQETTIQTIKKFVNTMKECKAKSIYIENFDNYVDGAVQN